MIKRVWKRLRDLLKKIIGTRAWYGYFLFAYGYWFKGDIESGRFFKAFVTLAAALIFWWLGLRSFQKHEDNVEIEAYLEGYKTGYRVGKADE